MNSPNNGNNSDMEVDAHADTDDNTNYRSKANGATNDRLEYMESALNPTIDLLVKIDRNFDTLKGNRMK